MSPHAVFNAQKATNHATSNPTPKMPSTFVVAIFVVIVAFAVAGRMIVVVLDLLIATMTTVPRREGGRNTVESPLVAAAASGE